MNRATYRTMPELIENMKPFTHGSCHAVNNLDKEYVIVSYSTPIARAIKFNGEWFLYLNSRKYSQTTSRLQGIIRRVWPYALEVDGPKELYMS